MDNIENYTPPVGWRAKSPDEHTAEGDRWSHAHDGSVHTPPAPIHKCRHGERIVEHSRAYLPNGGFVLTPIAKPQEGEHRHFIVCDDPVACPAEPHTERRSKWHADRSGTPVASPSPAIPPLTKEVWDVLCGIVACTAPNKAALMRSELPACLSVQLLDDVLHLKDHDGTTWLRMARPIGWYYPTVEQFLRLYKLLHQTPVAIAEKPAASDETVAGISMSVAEINEGTTAEAKEYDEAEAATRTLKTDHLDALSSHARYKGWAAMDKEWFVEYAKSLHDSVWQDALAEFAADTTTSHPEQVPMAGGKVASSKIPPLHLIPTVALEVLADRCALGLIRKPGKAWNATTNNQEILLDRDFAIDRCGHVMLHVMQLRDRLLAGDVGADAMGDASAVSWGGMFLSCVVDAMAKAKKESK